MAFEIQNTTSMYVTICYNIYVISSINYTLFSFKALTSLNRGQIPHEVNTIVNYDLDGEQAKSLANADLMQLKKEYMDCEKEHKEEINQLKNEYMECEMEKIQIESNFSYYREGHLPKNIAGLLLFCKTNSSLSVFIPIVVNFCVV